MWFSNNRFGGLTGVLENSLAFFIFCYDIVRPRIWHERSLSVSSTWWLTLLSQYWCQIIAVFVQGVSKWNWFFPISVLSLWFTEPMTTDRLFYIQCFCERICLLTNFNRIWVLLWDRWTNWWRSIWFCLLSRTYIRRNFRRYKTLNFGPKSTCSNPSSIWLLCLLLILRLL